MREANPTDAAKQAGITGAESDQIVLGDRARELLADATLAGAFATIATYYARKQLEAQHDVDDVMKWQMHRVALVDVWTTLEGYLSTGQLARERMGMFRKILARMQREPRRVDRFEARKT